MTVSLEALQRQFQEAIVDLWWMSETDAPFELMVWPQAFDSGFSVKELMTLTALDDTLTIQETSVEQFFAPAIRAQDWHGDLEKEEIRRFQWLKTLISEQLSHVKIYRMGETHFTILIVGQTQTNAWIALTTQAVET